MFVQDIYFVLTHVYTIAQAHIQFLFFLINYAEYFNYNVEYAKMRQMRVLHYEYILLIQAASHASIYL